MQRGKTLQELAAEVQRQQDVKADYIAPSTALSLVAREPSAEAGETRNEMMLKLKSNGGSLGEGDTLGVMDSWFTMGHTFHSQMASSLGVPLKYWERMRTEAPALLANNANHWLQQDDRRRMVRTLDGRARAYLSDSYRPLDNFDLCEAVLPVIADGALGLTVKSCEVTERRLYIQVVSDKLVGDVKVGDTIQGGFTISNSEIGAGGFNIDEWILRLLCLNGMTGERILGKYHAGSKAGGLMEDVQAFYRDSTRRLDDAAFFAKVTDTVRHVVSEERFAVTLKRLQGATETQIKPVEGVEVVAKRLNLNDTDKASVLNHLIEGGDLSLWGIGNAVTRMAHDAADYDRGIEFQKAGNDVIELPRSAWQELGALAA